MVQENKVESFKLIIRPGDKNLKSGDYWAIFVLCAVGAFVLLAVVGSTV